MRGKNKIITMIALCFALVGVLTFGVSAVQPKPDIECQVFTDNATYVHIYLDGECYGTGEHDFVFYDDASGDVLFETTKMSFTYEEFNSLVMSFWDDHVNFALAVKDSCCREDYFYYIGDYDTEEGFAKYYTYDVFPEIDTPETDVDVKPQNGESLFTISRSFVYFFLSGADEAIIDWFACVVTLVMAGGLVGLILYPVRAIIGAGRSKR